MALLTIQVGMRSSQRELAFVVIKGVLVPACGFMASRAIRAELTIVPVIFLMTGIAICWSAFEDSVLMALFARHISMSAI